ncbi:MAG TPA: glycosyltransferase [Candidatus Rubrimentiphilum sp.]|nr:glycosyltransferase [Candidatus Rubrimentiphilum sp.]
MSATHDDTPLQKKIDAIGEHMAVLKTLSSGGVPSRRQHVAIERYGELFPDATIKPRGGRDVIWLGIIDYHYRIQRPQHLAMQRAAAGDRVFYVALEFERLDDGGRFRVEEMPEQGVFILRLRLNGTIPPDIYGGFSASVVAEISKSLDEALIMLNVAAPVVVVEYPSWYYAAAGIPGATIVHDCLDYIGGFNNVPQEVVELERDLTKNADAVLAASAPLAAHVAPREATIVRNASDVAFFAEAARFEAPAENRRPVIGYFGTIQEWFAVDWIASCARSRPDWDFHLIGHATRANVQALEGMENVRMLGEQPYATLPDYLANFDVAVIPFIVNDLITCTNPVKLYEYMAAGKAVVASPMPEVIDATPLAYIARDERDFERQIEKALAEDSPELRKRRFEWAQEQTWRSRAKQFAEAIESVTPSVSIVVLTYNNWQFTKDCLHSILTLSDYPKLEIIVVDNGSTDETLEELDQVAARDSRVSIIRNDRNLGFAAGNNVGLRAAAGEYVILLNNDTYVTKGWVRDLIRPMTIDPKVGLTGPLTNNIGNEQKINIRYSGMLEMAAVSRQFVRLHLRRRFDTHNLAFFCVAIRREVLETIGFLDEEFGLGFFEDDDYCRRALQAGFRIEIVDDVFVHHHLSASFDALGSEQKAKQMQKNKAIFERRWGPWEPHRYRDALGFG